MNISELEKKVLCILKRKSKISVEKLSGKLSLFELLNLIVFKDEFTKIEIFNVDLSQKILFDDDKYKDVFVPYFDIKKKEGV